MSWQGIRRRLKLEGGSAETHAMRLYLMELAVGWNVPGMRPLNPRNSQRLAVESD